MANERLGHILLRQGSIKAQELDFCLNVQKNNGGERLGRVLRHYGFIDDDQIARALASQADWEVYTGAFELDQDAVAVFGLAFIVERMVFPVRVKDEAVFILSRTDDMALIDTISSQMAGTVRFCVAPESRLRRALEGIDFKEKGQPVQVETIDNLAVWLEDKLNLAIKRGSTDIHIEPSQKAVEVRVRVDGILYFFDSLRLDQLPRLVNVVFHKAEVTISDFGHFHDARFTHRWLNRMVDVRVSHIPTIHGSSLVLRLLDKGKAAMALTTLGYGQEQWELIAANLVKPEGLTLIVGPTGCGKSTTLYAVLNHLKSISRKIVTVEDPVEMPLSLMSQVQTNEKRGLSFGNTVRAFLRHDPNIILIGEIRDNETAQEAMRAAMTGHKVFATVHANRPIDAILRLNDLGVPFTHLSGNLTMIITQRLIRCLCPNCKTSRVLVRAKLLPHEAKYLLAEEQLTWEPRGCALCSEGFHGRTVAAEILSVDQSIENLIGEGDICGLRRHLAQVQEHLTMFDHARRLVGEGIISVPEAVRTLG